MLQLVRIEDGLPEGFEALRLEADREGRHNMSRLAAERSAGEPFFFVLLGVYAGGELVGIGGVTAEPRPLGEPALRLRRLYVRPAWRRGGVGRTLAAALVQEAFDQTALVTVHAGDGEAALFWEAQDFTPVQDRPWSHELRR